MMANLYFQHHSSSFQHHMIRQKSMLKCWKLFLFFLFQYFLMNGKFKRTAFIWNINFTFFAALLFLLSLLINLMLNKFIS